jgi:hypothetical protein
MSEQKFAAPMMLGDPSTKVLKTFGDSESIGTV